MKKLLILIMCILSLSTIFANKKECSDSCYKNHLKKYHFTTDKLIIENEKLYVDIDNHIVSLIKMNQDEKGYYIELWDDNDYCPKCEKWTWSESLNCCLNSPKKCEYSCETKYDIK